MSTNSNNWNETLMNDWVATQRKYWDTWSDFARKSGVGGTQDPAANPFGAFGSFTANPFAQNPFMQNPFAQNPMGGNPFGGAANPFTGMVEQWWSSVKPQAQGDIGGVAQRFYDMGKKYMTMAEGLFSASNQEQPELAMQMWMSSMHTALQQWITQIQNNTDMLTPDLPGVSGATLDTWARVADSVAPWLNVSQRLLQEIAEGHLPGGVQMPGFGAAQAQLSRALSMPGLGYTREQQESFQKLARHLLAYHDAQRAYKIAFAKTAISSLDAVQKRLQSMHEEGNKIESLRALYDMWVDASEEAYAKFAMSDEYQVVYGDLVNALMRVRQDINAILEQQYELMNIPTRSEIDTMEHRQQEARRDVRHLQRQIEELRAQLAELGGAKPAAAPRPASKSRAPQPENEPAGSGEDDLTAIKGIGPKMMEKLYAEGIKSFSQLAKMNADFAEQLDETLKTQGRILRDDWIGQAKKLRG
jgi:class III poly(R)-hydroxyalkanoic acid synthase PhaE subunit